MKDPSLYVDVFYCSIGPIFQLWGDKYNSMLMVEYRPCIKGEIASFPESVHCKTKSVSP